MSYTPPPPPPGGSYPPPPPGGTPYGGGMTRDYAEPGPRIIAGLVDFGGLLILAYIVMLLVSTTLGSLLILVAYAWGFYNGYLNGQTGQSTGKKMQNIKVVSQETGQPIGGGVGIVRGLCHILDNIYFAGYIYGLFIDKDKQTFADKILKTVVVKA